MEDVLTKAQKHVLGGKIQTAPSAYAETLNSIIGKPLALVNAA
jgi:hypothetical protein